MRVPPHYRRGVWIALILVGAGSLAACSVSVTGGVLGLVATIAVGALLLMGTSATQSGCDTQPCLSPIEPIPDAADGEVGEPDFGPCLSPRPPDIIEEVDADADADADPEPDFGPCLSPPWDIVDDRGVDLGVCLSPIPPDADAEAGPEEVDIPIGPCLDPLPPDEAPDAGEIDVGPCLSDVPEPDFGPCLSPPAPDWGPDAGTDADVDAAQAPPAKPASARAQAIERLASRGVLPPDVLARLTDRREG